MRLKNYEPVRVLDEIALKLSPEDRARLYDVVEQIHRHGVTGDGYYKDTRLTFDGEIQTHLTIKKHDNKAPSQ